MENKIIIHDLNLASILEKTLKRSGNRNPDLDYKTFTLEELETITELNLENAFFQDIGALKYCTNLRNLSIISVNAKNIDTKQAISIGDFEKDYKAKKNDIKDYSVISELTNLESLAICYNDNLKYLDISKLTKLSNLNLNNNPNFTDLKGIEKATKLDELILYRNGILQPFNIQSLTENLCDLKLDFDMYPILKRENPDIDKVIYESGKEGGTCKWIENISNIRTNEISIFQISEMDKKAQEILQEIIFPGYRDIEKITAIYAYIVQNVRYDHEALAAANGEKNATYEEAKNNRLKRIDEILDKKQSSYNAILKGKSVCEGYTNMMHYLLNSVGIKSQVISCSSDLNNELVGQNSSHAVIKVAVDDNWYYFDPTWDAQKPVLKNFMKTKDEFSTNHKLSLSEIDVKSPETKAYTREELDQILKKVILDKNNIKQNNNKSFESEITDRGEDIQENIYSFSRTKRNYDQNELSEKYSRHLTGENKELAQMFAKLDSEDFWPEYADEPSLKSIEKVTLDMGEGKKEYYRAIFKEYSDDIYDNKGYEQYYEIGDNKKITLYSERDVDDVYDELDNNSKRIFTEKNASDRLQKSILEDALGKNRVTEVARVTDVNFLDSFSSQIGEKEALDNLTIVASINENGEEEYDLAFADINVYKSILKDTGISKIKSLDGLGIKSIDKTNEEIFIDSGIKLPQPNGTFIGQMDVIKNLKEFETEDGKHRYAITRDQKGNLGFTEIYKENEKETFGQDVRVERENDLKEIYKGANLNLTDLNKAMDIINRTKEKQQQQYKSSINYGTEGR